MRARARVRVPLRVRSESYCASTQKFVRKQEISPNTASTIEFEAEQSLYPSGHQNVKIGHTVRGSTFSETGVDWEMLWHFCRNYKLSYFNYIRRRRAGQGQDRFSIG